MAAVAVVMEARVVAMVAVAGVAVVEVLVAVAAGGEGNPACSRTVHAKGIDSELSHFLRRGLRHRRHEFDEFLDL